MGVGGGAVARFMGGGPDEVSQNYARADPARLGSPTVPVALIHGADDAVLPTAISLGYGERFGIPVTVLADTGHFELIEPDSAAWPAVLRAIRSVVAR